MNKISGFTFFNSYYECLIDLSEEDKKEILLAIVDYVFLDKEPIFTTYKKSIWVLIKPHLEVSKNRSGNAKKPLQTKTKPKEIKSKSKRNQKEIKKKSNQNLSPSYSNSYSYSFNNNKIDGLFKEFLEMRKKLKAVNSERAIKMLVEKLNNYDDNIKCKMLEQSIVNSWKGLFDIVGGKKVEKTPEWFDKEIKSKPLDLKKQQEVADMLKEYE